MKPNRIPQLPQPPEEMTDEELEAFKKKLDQMYLANRYLRTPRPQVNSKLVITCINIDHEAITKAGRRNRRKAALALQPRPERVRHMYQCRLLSKQVGYLCDATP
jgi:hypothetical protein